MKQHIVPAIFVILSAILASIVVLSKKNTASSKKVPEHSKIVVSANNDVAQEHGALAMLAESDDNTLTSFIALESNEKLLGVLAVDFDSDDQDDQINLIRKSSSPYLSLLIGLYNSKTGTYERTAEITTRISDEKTFSYNALDVVGDHKLALVYQGTSDSGESVLQMYRGSYTNGRYHLTSIGNFHSNGTISIQQSTRNEAYELAQTNGASFPVVVYNILVDDSGKATGDQLNVQYNWSGAAGQYVEINQTRVQGKKTTQSSVSLDGSIKSFGTFLTGLWYKTSNTGHGVRYISFDYDNSEVIQLFTDMEEVYQWGNSFVRGRTISFYGTNISISNIQKRYNISVVDTDEITVRLQDDLRMADDESDLWNGSYKRMNIDSTFNDDKKALESVHSYIDALQAGGVWATADGASIIFSNNEYTAANDFSTDTGNYAGIDVGTTPVLMFRSETLSPYFARESYMLERIDDNEGKSSIALKPVEITLNGCYQVDNKIITITSKTY